MSDFATCNTETHMEAHLQRKSSQKQSFLLSKLLDGSVKFSRVTAPLGTVFSIQIPLGILAVYSISGECFKN